MRAGCVMGWRRLVQVAPVRMVARRRVMPRGK